MIPDSESTASFSGRTQSSRDGLDCFFGVRSERLTVASLTEGESFKGAPRCVDLICGPMGHTGIGVGRRSSSIVPVAEPVPWSAGAHG